MQSCNSENFPKLKISVKHNSSLESRKTPFSEEVIIETTQFPKQFPYILWDNFYYNQRPTIMATHPTNQQVGRLTSQYIQLTTAKNNKLKCNTNALPDIPIYSICAPQFA